MQQESIAVERITIEWGYCQNCAVILRYTDRLFACLGFLEQGTHIHIITYYTMTYRGIFCL